MILKSNNHPPPRQDPPLPDSVVVTHRLRDENRSDTSPLLSMQVPLWAFLTSLLLALTAQNIMAAIARRSFPTLLTTIKPLLPPTFALSIPLLPHRYQPQASLRTFATTPAAMSSKQFLEIAKGRRSIYPLKKESVIDDKKIQEIVTEALLHVPSAFNSQTTRIVLLLKGEHDKLWDITTGVLKGIVPEASWSKTEQRMNMFAGAYGTVSSAIPLCPYLAPPLRFARSVARPRVYSVPLDNKTHTPLTLPHDKKPQN
jgi:hypothetical protein